MCAIFLALKTTSNAGKDMEGTKGGQAFKLDLLMLPITVEIWCVQMGNFAQAPRVVMSCTQKVFGAQKESFPPFFWINGECYSHTSCCEDAEGVVPKIPFMKERCPIPSC